jgi:hypothetical protein
MAAIALCATTSAAGGASARQPSGKIRKNQPDRRYSVTQTLATEKTQFRTVAVLSRPVAESSSRELRGATTQTRQRP